MAFSAFEEAVTRSAVEMARNPTRFTDCFYSKELRIGLELGREYGMTEVDLYDLCPIRLLRSRQAPAPAAHHAKRSLLGKRLVEHGDLRPQISG